MTTLAFAWPDWLVGLTTVLFLAICVIMVLTVLIQKPQGGGLASAFGGSGAGSGQTAFGAKTGDALTVFTIVVFVVYLAFAVGLNFAMKPRPLADGAAATSTEPKPTDGATPEQPAPSGEGTPAGQTPGPAETPKPDAPKPEAPKQEPSAAPTIPPAPPADAPKR